MTIGSFAELVEPRVLAGRPGAIDAWRELAELRSNPFLTPEWYFAWLESHPREKPFLITWGDQEVRGVLPLIRAGPPLGALRFAGARRGDWFTLACAREDEVAMAASCGELLRRLHSGWQLLDLGRVDLGVEVDDQPGWIAELGSSARRRRGDVLPFIAFSEGGYQGYLAARSRNFRSQVGRRRRKLERERGLSFRMTTDEADLSRDLESFFALHEERWRGRGGSTALSADAKDHHRRFAAAALERGWLRLWIAEADGEPAAAWYGWRIGDRYCYSLSGLREAYEPYGLGTVLLAHTIEQAAEEGTAIYDLMWGDEAYKTRFETGRREVSSWAIGRRRHPGKIALRAVDALRSSAHSLPPALRDAARSVHRSVGRDLRSRT